jgi:prolipoprotein diacylglyceryltransferase
MLTPSSLLLALGVVLGLGWCAYHAPARDSLRLTDQGLVALAGALAGGRLGYIAMNWEYFQTRPAETWQVWLGGLSGFGAAYGFVIAIFLIALASGEHPGALADHLLPLGLLLGASAWLAAWWAGDAYGAQIGNLPVAAWLVLPARDESGAWALRWPTQLAGAVLTLALWAVLERLDRRFPALRRYFPGSLAALGLLGVGAIFFALAYTRVDPTRFWRGLRLDAWAGLGLIALGLLAGLALRLPFVIHRQSDL